jgi:hypothetical protein
VFEASKFTARYKSITKLDLRVSDGVIGLCDIYNIVPNIGGVKLEAKGKISVAYTERGKPYVFHLKDVLRGGFI